MPTSRDASDYVDATELTRARREWVYRAENNVMRTERENRRGRAHPDDRYIVLRSRNNNMIIYIVVRYADLLSVAIICSGAVNRHTVQRSPVTARENDKTTGG
jgi:hypothetical protein